MPFNFTLTSETIPFKGGEITVRGLSVPDLTQLVIVNRASAMEVYANISQRAAKSNFSAEDAASIAMDIATKFPSLVAHVICLAADEPDGYEAASKLPLDVQVVSLEKITSLTFAMTGGLKNFVETVTRIAQNANGLELAPRQALKNGSAA